MLHVGVYMYILNMDPMVQKEHIACFYRFSGLSIWRTSILPWLDNNQRCNELGNMAAVCGSFLMIPSRSLLRASRAVRGPCRELHSGPNATWSCRKGRAVEVKMRRCWLRFGAVTLWPLHSGLSEAWFLCNFRGWWCSDASGIFRMVRPKDFYSNYCLIWWHFCFARS